MNAIHTARLYFMDCILLRTDFCVRNFIANLRPLTLHKVSSHGRRLPCVPVADKHEKARNVLVHCWSQVWQLVPNAAAPPPCGLVSAPDFPIDNAHPAAM